MQAASMSQTTNDRLFGWWYRIAAPPEVPDDAPLHKREAVRIGKLTSLAFLIEYVYITIVVGVGLSSNRALLPILIANYVMMTIGVILNRMQKVRLAGIFAFLTLEVGMILNIMQVSAAGGLSSFNLSLLDILIQPELIAVSLFPAWVVLPVAAFNCVFIAGCLMFLPKTAELAHALSLAAYNAYERPIALQIITALVTFLWVSSAIKEMRRADSVGEVNKLTQALAVRQQAEVQEKRQLEDSIKQIIEVHMLVANGNFSARVPLDQNNVLWSIAGSLNNLLARFQRWRQEALRLQQTEQAMHQVLQDIQQAKKQGEPLKGYRTGTVLDPLIQEALRLQRTEQAAQQLLQDIRQAKERGEPLKAYRTGTALDPLIVEIASEMKVASPLERSSNSGPGYLHPPDRSPGSSPGYLNTPDMGM